MENEKQTGLDKGVCSQFQAGVIEGTRSDKSFGSNLVRESMAFSYMRPFSRQSVLHSRWRACVLSGTWYSPG